MFCDSVFPPTNFKLFACHQDLGVRNDGWGQAELQPVSFIHSIKDTIAVKDRMGHTMSFRNKDQTGGAISHLDS